MEHGLRIKIRDTFVDIGVTFGVGRFIPGMFRLQDKLDKIVKNSIEMRFSACNLDHISGHQQLADVKFTLSNRGCYEMLCQRIAKVPGLLKNIDNLNLSSNGITTLQPLTNLQDFKFYSIELKDNLISSIAEFHFIKHLSVHKISIIGNSVSNEPQLGEKLGAILPTLKKVDQTHVEGVLPPKKEDTTVDNRDDAIVTFNKDFTKVRAVDVNEHTKKEFFKLKNNEWNKVIVEHKGKASKREILDEMFKQFFNRIQFYPCYYKRGNRKDHFYLRKNFTALNTLLQKGLTMTMPSTNIEITFELHMKCAEWVEGQINWRHKLNYVLQKRMSGLKLNLNSFSSDSDFDDLFIMLSTVFGLPFVLNAARELGGDFLAISLQNNEISRVEALKFLKVFPNLITLDLRNNKIKSFEGLPPMPKIVEIFLDKNPFCVQYYDEPWRYIRDLIKIFPNLEHVDGIRIDNNSNTAPLRNFFVSRGVYTLSESFVNFFFKLYDSSHRNGLKKLYEQNSMFSLVADLNKTRDSCNDYDDCSRNPLHYKDLNESRVFTGKAITAFFATLPQTQHDFTTMNVDVPLLTATNVLITVTGYFMELGTSLNDKSTAYGFTRTFNLQRGKRQFGTLENTFKYFVKNEMLLIRNISPLEAHKAFKKNVIAEEEVRNLCQDLLPVKSQEEEASILLLNQMTKLNKNWCKRWGRQFKAFKLNISFYKYFSRQTPGGCKLEHPIGFSALHRAYQPKHFDGRGF